MLENRAFRFSSLAQQRHRLLWGRSSSHFSRSSRISLLQQVRSIVIETRETSNPHSLRFLPGRTVLEDTADNGLYATQSHKAEEVARRSPLAKMLLGVNGVQRVYLENDFVTVTKGSDHPWTHVKTGVLAAMNEFFQSRQEPAVADTMPENDKVSLQKLMEALEKSEANKDQGKVVTLLDNMQKIMSSFAHNLAIPPNICRAFVRHHVSKENVAEAMTWLHRLDDASTKYGGDDSGSLQDDFQSVLQLWAAASQDPAAPWRAEELIRRMEELEGSSGNVVVTTAMYNLLLQCWSVSGSPKMSEKMLCIFQSMTQSDNTSKLPNAKTYRLLIQSDAVLDEISIKTIVSRIKEEWNSIDKDALGSLMSSLLQSLAQHDFSLEAKELLQMAATKGISITPEGLWSVSRAQPSVKKKLAMMKLAEELAASKGAVLPVSSYEEPILFVLGSRKPGSFMKAMELVGNALDLYSTGKLACTPEKLTTLMERAIRRLKYLSRAAEADTMLQYLEARTLQDDSPRIDVFPSLSCFNNVMKAWADAGRVNQVGATLNRLLGYYNAGYTALLPSTASFGTYLLCLADTSNGNGAAVEAEDMMELMIALYESTGDDSCKPNAGTFNAVLLAWKKEKNKNKVEHSLAVLDRMLSLDVHPQTFTFDTIMLTILRSPLGDKYQTIVALLDQMETLNLEPQSFTYNIILDACAAAREDEKEEAWSRAQETFGRLQETKSVSGASYASFLKAIDKLMPVNDSRRAMLIESLHKKSQADGCLPAFKRKFVSMRKKREDGTGSQDLEGRNDVALTAEVVAPQV